MWLPQCNHISSEQRNTWEIFGSISVKPNGSHLWYSFVTFGEAEWWPHVFKELRVAWSFYGKYVGSRFFVTTTMHRWARGILIDLLFVPSQEKTRGCQHHEHKELGLAMDTNLQLWLDWHLHLRARHLQLALCLVILLHMKSETVSYIVFSGFIAII